MLRIIESIRLYVRSELAVQQPCADRRLPACVPAQCRELRSIKTHGRRCEIAANRPSNHSGVAGEGPCSRNAILQFLAIEGSGAARGECQDGSRRVCRCLAEKGATRSCSAAGPNLSVRLPLPNTT